MELRRWLHRRVLLALREALVAIVAALADAGAALEARVKVVLAVKASPSRSPVTM
jgi:hypothetical protein